jgi:hypothetical protein
VTPFAGHWSEIEPADLPRLAVLTDGFDRFLRNANGVSVITLWRDGTPIVQQIDGFRHAAAVDLVMDAIIDETPLRFVLQREP